MKERVALRKDPNIKGSIMGRTKLSKGGERLSVRLDSGSMVEANAEAFIKLDEFEQTGSELKQ